jgi:Legume lectin domain
MIFRRSSSNLFRRPRRCQRGQTFRPRVEQLEARLVPNLDFSAGFAGAGTALTLNGSAAVSGSLLRLTDGKAGEAGTAFSTAPQGVGTFTTDFRFLLTDPHADGFTFTIQGQGATALGPAGGGLGYGPDAVGGTGGISKSAAVKFDLFDNQGEGSDSTGLYTNGAAPTNTGSIDLSGTGIDLHSGHVFDVAMAYDGTNLKVTITDTATMASANHSYAVNIATTVGASTAFVGFTGATGGLTATQDILTWTYTANPPAPAAPTNVTATAGNMHVSVSWTASAGAASYNVYKSTTSNAETLFQQGVVGTSFADTAVTSGTTYFYEVTAVGVGGEGPKSNEASVTADGATKGLVFPNGFAGASGLLTLNGSTALNGSSLRLTDGKEGEAGSAFSTSQQNVATFTTDFKFLLTNPDGDGFTFTIQGQSATALGPSGGGLGYGPDEPGGTGGISKSVAVKFDLFDNQGEGLDSTGLYTNGASPTNAGSIDLRGTAIHLHSGDIFDVAMAYDGTTIKVSITDTATGGVASQSYAVNIPAIVGGNTAFVGFTGATGGLTATQDILSWTYTPGLSGPPAPTNVTATAGNMHVSVSWTASPGATSYNIYKSTASNTETLFQQAITGTSFADTAVTSGTTYFYKVTAVGVGGEGPQSAEASVTADGATKGLVFPGGFAGAGDLLTRNGSAAFSGSSLRLTDGKEGEAGSAFSTSQQNIAKFDTDFKFLLTSANGDGFTFTIQGQGATALGPSGGGLGYGPDEPGGTGGISKSVAVKFDLFNNQGEGSDSTGLYTNGASPTNVGSIDLSGTGIQLHQGDIFDVAMAYDGTTLTVTITDTVTTATAKQSYTVDIPTLVGGSTAFVGFTGATGGRTATQDILSWTFTPS